MKAIILLCFAQKSNIKYWFFFNTSSITKCIIYKFYVQYIRIVLIYLNLLSTIFYLHLQFSIFTFKFICITLFLSRTNQDKVVTLLTPTPYISDCNCNRFGKCDSRTGRLPSLADIMFVFQNTFMISFKEKKRSLFIYDYNIIIYY